ncbi:MAG TPA: plasma-membrane proton-efflux P-type ATPase [Anaerolineales bacterium]|nr:plasma-membrane proton-efflux P-type ATPase [Anaerolineales bacterium]
MVEGLTTADAEARLRRFGPNVVSEEKPSPILLLLKKLWGPVPWMLEGSLVLELVIGHNTQAVVIGLLLCFNAGISFFQENRAQNALALLQQRLSIQAKVRRDGIWRVVPSQELVPGDIIHLRVGDFVPADVTLLQGNLSADQSSLTGESLPVEVGNGQKAYAGSMVQRGEGDGSVIATGAQTFFGKTAELVRTAKTASHLESTILGIVRHLVALDVLLVGGVLAYSWLHSISFTDSIPFALILLVASVPVALPATFTLASALGARELAANGVLITRLTAIEEAAAMDVLCSDKTGTVTQNQLTLSAITPFAPNTEEDVLRLAAISSDESSQDPIDLAILKSARERNLFKEEPERIVFIPFDPLTKRTEVVACLDGRNVRIIKGYPRLVAAMTYNSPDITSQVDALAKQGYRVIGIASGSHERLVFAGLIGLFDPPRKDSRSLIESLRDLAVRVVMITGDSRATAQAISSQVGLGNSVCSADELRKKIAANRFDCDVVAGVLPEDKYLLVQNFQKGGHVVGMTGDGVNDAPALKQAEVGIAVSNATDVARAAASAILTKPGLSDVLSAVKIGRQIYQRMLTYTLNKIIKTFQIALFLSIGLWLTGTFVTTPRLVVLLLFANDFVTMSIASDHVSYSRTPDRWVVQPLVIGALFLAAAWLVFSFGILYLGRDIYHLGLQQLQTLIFVMLVFTGQANVYLVRERHSFWRSRPSTTLLLSTLGDAIVVIALAALGILMAPISLMIIAWLVGLIILYALALDVFKVAVFQRMGFAERHS